MLRGIVDAELVDRARVGDPNAFTLLYRRYARSVAAIVAERIRLPEDRADAVQDTFVHAFEHLGQLRDPERFNSWLYAIARNAANQTLRHRQRSPQVRADDFERSDPGPGPVELAELAELAGRVESAGTLLSARDATALTLAVTFGFGPAELAVALGVSEGNAKVILHRARRRLRAVLDADYKEVAVD